MKHNQIVSVTGTPKWVSNLNFHSKIGKRFSLLFLLFNLVFYNISTAQLSSFPCREYVIRQIANSGATNATTELGVVYRDNITGNGFISPVDTFPSQAYNGLAYYNGKLYAWLQFGANTGVGGNAIVSFNPNLTSNPTSTSIVTSNSAVINAASIDPATGIYYGGSTNGSTNTTFIINRVNVSGAAPTQLNDLTVTVPSGATVSSAAIGDITVVGNLMYVYMNDVGLMKFTIPSTSTNSVSCTMVGSVTTGTSNNRIVGSSYWINTDTNFLYGYGSAASSAPSTQDRLLKINILTGAVTEISAGGATTSQSDGAGCESGNFTNPLLPDLYGNVFDDANGMTNSNLVDGIGIGTPSSVQLYANLVNASGMVVDTAIVNADGSFSFIDVGSGTYTVQIGTILGTIGTAVPAPSLPSGWVNTGDVVGKGAGTAATLGISTSITVAVTSGLTNAAQVTNINFGIEKIPVGANYTAASQLNPGETTQVPVPVAAFTGTDLEDGTYPTGLSGKTVTLSPATNGDLYYNGIKVTASQVITGFDPTKLTIDPTGTTPTGQAAVTATFTYSVNDAAGQPSAAKTITMPFEPPIFISGAVWDDANGDAVKAAEEAFTNSGGLNAVLTDAAGKVIQVVAVNAATGAYLFDKSISNTAYKVVLSTTTPIVGSTLTTSSLPTSGTGDWVNTGVNPGGSTPTTSNKTGILAVTTASTNVINRNFGIEEKPLSVDQSYIITSPAANTFLALNGTGTGSGSNPGPLRGSDAEDQPTVGSLGTKTITITSLPTKGQLWYNGVQITAPGNITNYNPALLQIKFTGSGYKTTSFGYSYVDAAGVASTIPATYTLNWSISLPVHLASFTGVSERCDVVLSWTTAQENGFDHFEVQLSKDGIQFLTIGNIEASRKSNGSSYSYRTTQDATTAYYRLNMVDNSGSSMVSKTVTVSTDCNAPNITMFPNPVKDKININGLNAGDRVMIYNMQGQLVHQLIANSNVALVNMSTYPTGNYEVMVSNGHSVIKAGKFVKN